MNNRIAFLSGWVCMAFVLILTLFSSCAKELNASDYLAWVRDPRNGLNLMVTQGEISFRLQYKPVDYLVVNDLKMNHPDKSAYEESRKRFEGMQYFELYVKRPVMNVGKQAMEGSSHALPTSPFSIQNRIHLLADGAEFPCAAFHPQSGKTQEGEEVYLLGFPFHPAVDLPSMKVSVEGEPFGLDSPVQFEITGNSISRIPQLSI